MIKSFRVNILLRILLIAVLIGLLIYFVFVELKILRSVYIAIFLILTIGEFVWYVDRTNRDFTTFLLSLLQGDFTTTFSENGKGKSFNSLYTAFNKITKKFEEISSEKEVQHIYLEAMVNHVRVGILSFDENEKIHLMNQSLQKMLDRPQMAFLNNLNSVHKELPDLLRSIKPKENRLLKIQVNDELLQLSIHASEFLLGEQYYKLISIQNIKNELDANELDAWQKLIRVLTHEIMNSVTPITSLSGSLKQLVEAEKSDSELLEKLSLGLNAIELRSAGLQNFTDAYRQLTKLPIPHFVEFNIKEQCENLSQLLKNELNNTKIEMVIPNELVMKGDKDLMNQVFINLIKNSIEATNDISPSTISIRVWQDEGIHLEFSDNGTGIEEDKLDQIFIPFFTTKNTGSGIGLALCRQIVRLHGGTISVNSKPNQGATFIISI